MKKTVIFTCVLLVLLITPSTFAAVLVDLDASSLPEGDLSSWVNAGTAGGTFYSAESDEDEIPDQNALVEIVDGIKAFNTTHIWASDIDQWKALGAPESLHELMELIRQYCIRTGISTTATCTPYQVGNVPTMGEHCAWTESSAVPFCNAVLGARTNTETAHSSFAIALTGKVPLSGFHIKENRLGE